MKKIIKKKSTLNLQNDSRNFKEKLILKISNQIKPLLKTIYSKDKLSKIEKIKINYFKNKYHINEMFSKQNINRIYNKKKPFKNRINYVKKIRQYHNFFKYNDKTLHLAIAYMDLVFSRCEIKKKEINLILYVSLNLAAKFYENKKKKEIPKLKKSVENLKYEYCKEQLQNCENVIFEHILKFNLNIRTPFCFLTQFLYFDIITNLNQNLNKVNFIFKNLAFKILDFTLNFYESNKYLSSTIAAICIYCTRKLLGLCTWNNFLSYLTEIKLEYFEDFGNFILKKFLKENLNLLDEILKSSQIVIKKKIKNSLFLKNSVKNKILKRKFSFSLEKKNHMKIDKNSKNINLSFETFVQI